MTRYNDCLREHVRLFLSTDVIIRSSNVTPIDDYEQRYNILFIRLPLNLANRNNVGIPMHKNMSLSRFKSSIDSCAAIIQKWLLSRHHEFVSISSGNKYLDGSQMVEISQ